MPALTFGTSSYERTEGDLPELPVVNMYAEKTDSEGIVLQSRPPIVSRGQTLGSGPIRALFIRADVVASSLFTVSGLTLYQNDTSRGTISGASDSFVSIDGNETGIMVCAGEDLHTFDGTTFATVSLPDGTAFDALKVICGASRFIVIRKDTGRFYFTPPLLRTFDALDFATAESSADDLLDMLFLDDTLILFGPESVEFWPNTGDSNAPFVPLQGRVLERGIRATGCATSLGSTFAWVTDVNTVCVGDENNIVSNPGLQARIAASSAVSLFNFFIDGMEFLCLRLDNETQVFNQRTGTWSEFSSHNLSNWIARCHSSGIFGSAIDGRTLEFGPLVNEIGLIFERRFRAGFPINGGGVQISNLRLRANPGQTEYLAGEYADPVVEMRFSRDAAQTWSNWRATSLGEQGNYRQRIEWRQLGLASAPGFMAEFRVTSPVGFRASGVFANEPTGGR